MPSEPKRFDTPVIGPAMRVSPEWIDYNDHLNVAYYTLIFDRSAEAAVDILNLGEAYRRGENKALVTAQAHTTHIRELKQDAELRATFRLLDADAKSLHVYQELYHAEGWLAATQESLLLHVDLGAGEGPKVVRMSEAVQADVQTMLRYHESLPRPKYVGRTLGIRRR
ncbi:MAG: thioesterase family protein [Rhizobiaceae bacterium]|nr:thioesterase family protein [Rhizobiaceae bacterium]